MAMDNCASSLRPSVFSHWFSNSKVENAKAAETNPYNLSNDHNKIVSLEQFRVLQNPNGEK